MPAGRPALDPARQPGSDRPAASRVRSTSTPSARRSVGRADVGPVAAPRMGSPLRERREQQGAVADRLVAGHPQLAAQPVGAPDDGEVGRNGADEIRRAQSCSIPDALCPAGRTGVPRCRGRSRGRHDGRHHLRNCSGELLLGVDRASSGRGWTSTMTRQPHRDPRERSGVTSHACRSRGRIHHDRQVAEVVDQRHSDTSMVFAVYVSKVRMPRSHRSRCGCPS